MVPVSPCASSHLVRVRVCVRVSVSVRVRVSVRVKVRFKGKWYFNPKKGQPDGESEPVCKLTPG